VVRFDYDQQYLLNEVKRSFDWPTVPIVIKREGNDIQFVGGYQDLTESLQEHE
jgi:glutaredoxin-related protein